MLQARGESDANGFHLELRLIVNELPQTQGSVVQTEMELDVGFIRPILSPSNSVMATSTGSYMKDPLNTPPAYEYQFLDRNGPVLTLLNTWQQL